MSESADSHDQALQKLRGEFSKSFPNAFYAVDFLELQRCDYVSQASRGDLPSSFNTLHMSLPTKARATSKKVATSSSIASTPSANWLALQKKLPHPSPLSKPKSRTDDVGVGPSKRHHAEPPTKKRKTVKSSLEIGDESEAGGNGVRSTIAARGLEVSTSFPRGHDSVADADVQARPVSSTTTVPAHNSGGKESVEYLKKMVHGQLQFTDAQKQPGKYLALDCEMVGVGPDGAESSLARVSLVNYHGSVVLDEFVRQRERVVDYRTQFSGIRETDMIKAKPFLEVQKQVAELLKNRILVGHAVFNDLKALLLSHPRPLTRDTQHCAGKQKLLKTRYPALRKLVEQELGIQIQGGEHSSVVDARATMAVYRLHRKEWDKDFRPHALPTSSINTAASDEAESSLTRKRKHTDGGSDSDDQSDAAPSDAEGKTTSTNGKAKATRKHTKDFPGGGRKGVSSGLSTIVRRSGAQQRTESRADSKQRHTRNGEKSQEKWWTTLNGGPLKTGSSKGSMRLKVG